MPSSSPSYTRTPTSLSEARLRCIDFVSRRGRKRPTCSDALTAFTSDSRMLASHIVAFATPVFTYVIRKQWLHSRDVSQIAACAERRILQPSLGLSFGGATAASSVADHSLSDTSRTAASSNSRFHWAEVFCAVTNRMPDLPTSAWACAVRTVLRWPCGRRDTTPIPGGQDSLRLVLVTRLPWELCTDCV